CGLCAVESSHQGCPPDRKVRPASNMKSSECVRVSDTDGHRAADVAQRRARPGGGEILSSALARTCQWLLGTQHAAGYWVGELEGDTILESEYILLLAYLGRHQSERARKAARYIIKQQLEEGGWALYPGGELEISASVKAYFALKLTGHDPAAECMQRARAAIMAHGGADAVNSFTRFYL